ncbi:MarR family transcriptional regulator [Kribbella sp. NBC_01505]|uniref:MarR family winged helix-turn-helix transcriptional regulator n=1 Tax=Kribbella sp. NBC_01505 TaxID=2903580 RepID=UPI00386B4E17
MADSVEVRLPNHLAGHENADPVIEAALHRIIELARRHEEGQRAVAAREGLSLADCEVILRLAHLEPDECTPGQLAKLFHITAGSMTSRLGRLESGGYLTRTVQPGNRAQIQVELTGKGKVLHHRFADRMVEIHQDMVGSALPPKDRVVLNDLLQRVLTHVEATAAPVGS